MKIISSLTLFALPIFGFSQINVSGTLDDKANEKTGDAIDAVWSAPGKLLDKKKEKKENAQKAADSTKTASTNTQQPANTNPTTSNTNTPNTPTAISAYQNYDFVPGNDLIFEDHFVSDEDGEFPAHWKLIEGQGVVNKFETTPSFFLTQGNYAVVQPRISNTNYLSNAFSIETDLYALNGDYGLNVFFYSGTDKQMTLIIQQNEANCTFPGSNGLNADYPDNLGGKNFQNKWHHIAIAYKDKTLKVYIDQNRVLVVPDCNCEPNNFAFGGIASNNNPIKFSNVRIANGAKINMLDKLTTDGKIITYGISFDSNKSNFHPESMGTINQLYKTLNDNPTLKVEIDGFTDSDGDDASNLQLSEDRSNAVRDQLVKMGIDGSRISAKGFGETNPVSDNTTFEGKAKNRRVEIKKRN